MAIDDWVRLPSEWINDRRLGELRWKSGGEGADNTAALMVLVVIAHVADSQTGVARVTYDQICNTTGLSRAKVSNGLNVLRRVGVLELAPDGLRSNYRLANYDLQKGWAKLPAKRMYSGGRIAAFADFRLRKPVELDALKLFFLFVARRGRDTNLANIGYDRIEDYTGIKRVRIKAAISFLASLSLIYVEHVPSRTASAGISNAYRIVGLESYNHLGTRGRAMTEVDFGRDASD